MSRFLQRAMEMLPRLDRTQIRDLLREVAAEKDLYESLLQSMTTGVILTDGDHRIQLLNKAAERLVALDPNWYEQQVWEGVLDKDMAQFLQSTLEGQEKVPGREFAFDLPGGQVRTVLLGVTPLVKQGRIRGSLITLQDISEAKAAQARLRRAESLASLTTLAAGVAHEIKNPLGSMGIHIQLIKRSLDNPKFSLDQVRKDLEVIDEEISRLNGIVVDFLFAVRPMDTNLVHGSLGKVVKDLMEFLDAELQQARVDLVLDLTDQSDVICLDERFLKQALLNMVKNSLHAMEGGGTLTVRVQATKDDVRLIVQDTGEGIPEENLEKIFEPYFTTKSFGSGLGLTLVYKIVKEHGADIQISSQVGVGTTMTIVFPLPRKEPVLLAFEGEPQV